MGAPNIYRQTDSKTLYSVMASAIQDAGDFGINTIPRVKIESPSSEDFRDVTYSLPALANNLPHRRRIYWRPGGKLPGRKDKSKITATLSVIGRSTELDGRAAVPVNGSTEAAFQSHRWGDVREMMPGLIADARGQQELDLLDALDLDSVSGAAITFTGGPLNQNPTTTHPRRQIDEELDALHPFRQFRTLFRLVCFMDRLTLRTLATNPDYTGFGGGPTGMSDKPYDRETFLKLFKDTHGLDEIVVVNGIFNSAKPGLTPVIDTMSGARLVFLLLDVNMSSDLTGPESERQKKPDGALVYTFSRELDPITWIDTPHEWEHAVVRWEDGFGTPRANDSGTFGIKFDSASIYTP